MKLFASTLAGVGFVSAISSGVTPIEKVVELLNGMKTKGLNQQEKEKQMYNKYFMFCHDTSRDKAYQIEQSQETVEDANDTMKAEAAKQETLSHKIAENDAQIARNKQDLHNTELIRKKQNAAFVATNQDYSESIDAVIRAIDVIKAQHYDRSQAEGALLEVSKSSKISNADKRVLHSFMQTPLDTSSLDDELPTPPQANAYESSSGGVIKMLADLKEKFIAEQTAAQKQEANERHAYDMFHQDLTADSEDRTNENEQLSIDLQKSKETHAGANKLLVDTSAVLKSDQEYKADLDATCAKKASDFERRDHLRTEEIAAITKAIEILSSDDVMGSGGKHGMLSPAEPEPESFMTSFAQFFRNYDRSADGPSALSRVRSILSTHKNSSNLIGSLLMSIEEVSRTSYHPIDKVVEMIRNLIYKLQEEAKSEATQQAWCDKNLKLNENDRKQFKKDVQTNQAEVDKNSALISQKTLKKSDTEAAIVEATDALATATAQRAEEKEENDQTVKEARAAQKAVAAALVTLKEFYAKATSATSFMQQPGSTPEAPEIFDTPYTGMSAENGGVVGMLEVIQSDFARLEAETSAAESNAAESFEKFREDTTLDIAVKKKEVQHLTESIAYDKKNLKEAQTALLNSQNQLAAAEDTFAKLKPPCIRAPINYEQRVAEREAEIKSLRECVQILEQETS